jgi:hypothetical protein
VGDQTLKDYVHTRHGIRKERIKRQVILKVVHGRKVERERAAENNQ